MRFLFVLAALLPVAVSAQVLAMAAKPDSSHGSGYTERVMVGAYTEFGSISEYTYEYKVMNRPYHLDVDASNGYGIIGLMPLNDWFTLTAHAGYQKLSFRFRDYDTTSALQYIDTTTMPKIDSSDVRGKFDSHNVLAQLGIEVGLPLYSSYENSLLVKLYTFGTGVGGKMYFSDTKFESGEIWGYSWGGGLRVAWNRVALMSGVRSSHIYWRTYFDPSKKTGEQSDDDTFMLDYDANFNPYVSLLFAFN